MNHVNQFTARVHVSGAMGTSNVKVTFYAMTPPGVGDNGNWSPIAVKTIANIPQSGVHDTFSQLGTRHRQAHLPARPLHRSSWARFRGGNNGAQENVFDFQAAGSSPADPLFIRTAVRNPDRRAAAIQLSLRGLPMGWAAQIPHAWVWLDGKAEKEIDVMVWPIADVNVYQFGGNKEGSFPGMAPFVWQVSSRNYRRRWNHRIQFLARASIRSVARSIAWRSASALRFASSGQRTKQDLHNSARHGRPCTR